MATGFNKIALPSGGIGTFEIQILNGTSTPANAIAGANNKKIYAVDIDARDNPTEDVYQKFWDAASATPGTDDEYMGLLGKAGRVTSYLFPRGKNFATDISTATTKEAIGNASATSPTGTVKVYLILG
ncbi:hypothetical protein LCGC14_0734250 [marine sediment metagenome]|uniref:Uncharacterized protein n=1 Tax=marine sediment metagenome TaxID=412755 RepID=A0A0F9TG10_9ZZZZ